MDAVSLLMSGLTLVMFPRAERLMPIFPGEASAFLLERTSFMEVIADSFAAPEMANFDVQDPLMVARPRVTIVDINGSLSDFVGAMLLPKY